MPHAFFHDDNGGIPKMYAPYLELGDGTSLHIFRRGRPIDQAFGEHTGVKLLEDILVVNEFEENDLVGEREG